MLDAAYRGTLFCTNPFRSIGGQKRARNHLEAGGLNRNRRMLAYTYAKRQEVGKSVIRETEKQTDKQTATETETER